MIVEERNYAFAPADIERFLAIYESEGVVIATHVLGNLLGYFRTAVGHDLNEVVRWWDFADLNDRAQRRAALWEDPEWLDFAPRVPRPRAPAQSTADANRVVTGPLNRRL